MENYLMNYNDTTGEIKGFYLRSIHGDNIPLPIIEITEEKHNFYMVNNGKYKININTLQDELLPIPEPLPYKKTETEILKEQISASNDAINMLMMMATI